MGDATSETDMEFDWADETLHAEYGRRWLRRLLEARGEDPESWPAVLESCERLVQERVARATSDDLERIRACADALVAAARRRPPPIQVAPVQTSYSRCPRGPRE